VSLTTASLELANALKVARLVWEQTREGWKDAVSRDFEAGHWEPLRDHVEATITALDRLSPILARAMRECS
jgi:hypothetical protein